MITRLAYMLLFVCAAPADDNLLANPGFDDLDDRGNPRKWDSFIMQMEGAYGRADDIALNGNYSVTLHIPEPYAKDPLNNWSQNILANLGGEHLVVTGNIKTEKATEAAIWIQCFKKNPLRILASKSTSMDTPIYGTRDWTTVEMEIDVPLDTDFLVVRCVLRGRGTAWFDDTRVSQASDSTSDPSPAAFTPDIVESESDGSNLLLEDLQRANVIMQEMLGSLREGNARLQSEIRVLQQELTDFREALTSENAPGADPEEVPPIERVNLEPLEPRGHPLVPSFRKPKDTE